MCAYVQITHDSGKLAWLRAVVSPWTEFYIGEVFSLLFQKTTNMWTDLNYIWIHPFLSNFILLVDLTVEWFCDKSYVDAGCLKTLPWLREKPMLRHKVVSGTQSLLWCIALKVLSWKQHCKVFCSSEWCPSSYTTMAFASSFLSNAIHSDHYSSSLIIVFMNKFKLVKYYQECATNTNIVSTPGCFLEESQCSSLPARFLPFKVSKNISVPVEMPTSGLPGPSLLLPWNNCSKG